MLLNFFIPLLLSSPLTSLPAISETSERVELDASSRQIEIESDDITLQEVEMGFFYYLAKETFTLPDSYYQYPGFNQQLIAYDNSMFELVDGSRYVVDFGDRSTLYTWKRGDIIVLFPCLEWGTFYQLKAVNLTNDTHVKANLKEGALLSSPHLKRVEAIDPQFAVIRLSDGSMWKVWEGDYQRFRDWRIGDVLEVGCSHSPSGEAILYNVTLKDPVRKYIFTNFIGF